MYSRFMLLSFVLLSLPSLGQMNQISDIDRFGVFAKFDFAYNFGDQVFQPSTHSRFSYGVAFADRRGRFIMFLGTGAKFFKYTAKSPEPKTEFINELNENYSPVATGGLDSLIGVDWSSGGHFDGTSGAWLNYDFILNNKFRPTASLYFGGRGFNSYGNGYVQYIDPDYMDIEYISLNCLYYELKLGISAPFINKLNPNMTAYVNLGYRLIDYGNFEMHKTPMHIYTNESFVKRHRFSNCFTISITFQVWSNWV